MANLRQGAMRSIIDSVGQYLRKVEEALIVQNCGVADLIVLLANGRANLSDIAAICSEPPMMQIASSDVIRLNEMGVSAPLTQVVSALREASSEKNPHPPLFHMNLNLESLHIFDMQKANKIKELGVPDLLVILDRKWAALPEAAILCEEDPEIQRATCKLLWSHNHKERAVGSPMSLDSALQKVKEKLHEHE